MGIWRTTLAGLLMAFAGLAAGVAQTAGGDAPLVVEHVHGVVVDSVSGKPVGRVLVTSGDRRMAVMTDEEGRFGFDVRRGAVAPQGLGGGLAGLVSEEGYPMLGSMATTQMNLTARRPGYLQQHVMVSMPTYVSGGPVPGVTMKLVPEGVLHGRVDGLTELGEDGLPPGVRVNLQRRQIQDGMAQWMQVKSATANARGEFRFGELAPGEYKLQTQQATRAGGGVGSEHVAGFAAAYFGDTRDLASSPVIRVGSGQVVEANLRVRRTEFYRVTMPLATPLADAGMSVIVRGGDGSLGYRPGGTGAVQGYLRNGRYDVELRTYGPEPLSATTTVEVSGAAVKTSPVALGPGPEIPVHVHEEFTKAQTLEMLRKTAAQGAGAGPQVNVMLMPMGDGRGSFSAQPRSKDGGGELVVRGALSGTHRVVGYASVGYVAAMRSGTVDLLREPLVLGADGSAEPIEVTLRDDAGSLSGTVTMPGGGAAKGTEVAMVYAIGLDHLLGGQMRPNFAVNGRFTLGDMAPGRYLVLAEVRPTQDDQGLLGKIEYRNAEALKAWMSKGTVVTVVAGENPEIQVPLVVEDEGL